MRAAGVGPPGATVSGFGFGQRGRVDLGRSAGRARQGGARIVAETALCRGGEGRQCAAQEQGRHRGARVDETSYWGSPCEIVLAGACRLCRVQKHAPGLNGITPQIRVGSKRARAESASRASEISRLRRDKVTRRANHPKVCQAAIDQNILIFRNSKMSLYRSHPVPIRRGVSRTSRTWDGLWWVAAGGCRKLTRCCTGN